jgi:hypothetical protein
MSLLSICQEVAAEIPVAAPAAIVGNPDGTAQLMLALAQRAGEALARRPQGGWVAMIREHGFTTVALTPQAGSTANSGPGGVAVISGLSGLAAVANATWQAFGTGLKPNAIVTAVDAGAGTVTLNQPAAQPGAGQFTLAQADYPLPADFQRPIDNTFWDRARFGAMRGPQDPQRWQFNKSSVAGRAAIARRFRFRAVGSQTVLSIDPVPTDNGAPLVLEYVSTAWCRSAGGVAQNAWVADSDVGILDEYLIKLGLRWRVLRRLGMSYADELDEYERAVGKALAHDGAAAILNLAPAETSSLISASNLPEGNFGNVGG